MLLLSGVAESMLDKEDIIKGQVYGFNLFCNNEELDEQLDNIEQFFNDKGWDNIVIEQQAIIETNTDISNEVLLDAYKLAKVEGISGVVNKSPIH